jgi:hypothetical protein
MAVMLGVSWATLVPAPPDFFFCALLLESMPFALDSGKVLVHTCSLAGLAVLAALAPPSTPNPPLLFATDSEVKKLLPLHFRRSRHVCFTPT